MVSERKSLFLDRFMGVRYYNQEHSNLHPMQVRYQTALHPEI